MMRDAANDVCVCSRSAGVPCPVRRLGIRDCAQRGLGPKRCVSRGRPPEYVRSWLVRAHIIRREWCFCRGCMRFAGRFGAGHRTSTPCASKALGTRRLHGARRARGTSLCPGHILLFGHVKILILSLLSKSLPIKGREARLAAKVEGRAGANTRPTLGSRACLGE